MTGEEKEKIISERMSELQSKSVASQVKKYGGKKGYRKEMKRRGELAKSRKTIENKGI